MNILVLSTGGTIGSTAVGGVIAPDGLKALHLLELYAAAFPTDTHHFKVQTICSILSENADDTFYERLLHYFYTTDFTPYDGVILLHGTDTLSFTAPLLAMACRFVSIPVCLVSSNHVLDDRNANGLINFRAAVRYIESGYGGFVVPYRNSDSRTYYHLSTRLLEADAFLDDFHSAGDTVLAEYVADTVVFTSNPRMPTPQELILPRTPLAKKSWHFTNKILCLRSIPAFDFSALSIENGQFAAVLLTAFHSGTAPMESLCAFANRAAAVGVPVYLAPVKRVEAQYASTDALLKAKIRPLFALTPEAALAKLKIAYNLPAAVPSEILNRNLYFEEN